VPTEGELVPILSGDRAAEVGPGSLLLPDGAGVVGDGGPSIGATGTTPVGSTVTENEAGGTVVQGHFPLGWIAYFPES
jgi:hypothetical protein